MGNNNLYLLIPFFNFFNSNTRTANLLKSIQTIPRSHNLKIVVVEGLLPNQESVIKEKLNVHYLSYEIPNILWVKENLLNLAISKLPYDWKYVAWMDADVIMSTNYDNFASDIVDKLNVYDTVQLFKYTFWVMDTTYLKTSISPSFGFMSQLDRTEFGHPGYGWALNRKFYEQIGGFFENCIVGGYDSFYTYCITQDMEKLPTMFNENSLLYAEQHFHKFHGAKYSYLNTCVTHLGHGDYQARQYEKRYDILRDNNFTPHLDLEQSKNNTLICKNEKLKLDIKNYFINRKD